MKESDTHSEVSYINLNCHCINSCQKHLNYMFISMNNYLFEGSMHRNFKLKLALLNCPRFHRNLKIKYQKMKEKIHT